MTVSCVGEKGGADCKGMRELLGVNKMFYTLIIIVISQVYTFAKTNKKFKLRKKNLVPDISYQFYLLVPRRYIAHSVFQKTLQFA